MRLVQLTYDNGYLEVVIDPEVTPTKIRHLQPMNPDGHGHISRRVRAPENLTNKQVLDAARELAEEMKAEGTRLVNEARTLVDPVVLEPAETI